MCKALKKGAMKTAKILLLIPILLLVASSSLLGRVVEPWNEHSITWATKPQVTTEKQHWVKAPTNAYSPLSEDITALVKAVLNSVEGNCGFELKMSPEQRYRSARYASTQHSDPSRWPKLTITYTEMREAFYLKDHLGNIRVTIDGNGDVITTDDYYPFGLQMPSRSFNMAMTGDLYKYSGKELDKEGGLNWYRFDPARSYDPVIGRWNSVDPKAHLYASSSPYVYTLNNPMNFIDPNGMEVVGDSASVVGTVKDVNAALEEKELHQTIATLTNLVNSVVESVENLPSFIVAGTKQAVKDGLKLSKGVAETGVKTTARASDIVSDGSTVMAVGGLIASPFTSGSSLGLTTFALSVGTGADVTSTLAKGADAAFFDGSTDDFINQAFEAGIKFGSGRVIRSLAGQVVTRTGLNTAFRNTQSGQFVSNNFGNFVTAASDVTQVAIGFGF
jgi:RHS repeat-associated protein